MNERRTPDDLLASILGGKKNPPEVAPPPAAQPPAAPAIQPVATTPPPTPASEKIKATFYLPENTTNQVEAIWMKARQMVPKEKRGSVSKSHIVEVALALLAEEFNAKGAASRVFDQSEP